MVNSMDRLANRLILCVALIALVAGSYPLSAQSPPRLTLVFQPTTEDFLNPERGFYRFSDLTNPWNYNSIRSQGQTLVYGRILADNFRNGPFSQAFLNQIQAGFDAARANGIKVKPRVAYNDDGGADAPKSVILNHIQQLKPLWEANKDVIYHMDAGFIGGWGEWHSSTNGLDNNTDRTDILNAILAALPQDRMVGIRTPHFKRHIFNGNPGDATQKITAANAFDESNLTRVGHLNDCFLASSTDFGTYVTPGWSRKNEIDYIGGESMYAPHGGETCAASSFSTGANAISEMEQLHTDYLNIDYNPTVIQSWVNDGSFDEISTRLGYRFELKTAKVPTVTKPGGLLELDFTIENSGFGELFNPRSVELILSNITTGDTHAAALDLDPRLWSGGTTHDVHTYLGVPADFPEGIYSLGLRLADAEESLAGDVRYSVRFANTGTWDPTTGVNVLTTNLPIFSAAPGQLYDLPDEFQEIVDPSSLRLAGDIDLDGDVDGIDFLQLQSGLGSLYDAVDLQGWNANYGAALSAINSLLVVPEPCTMTFSVLFAVGSLLTQGRCQRVK